MQERTGKSLQKMDRPGGGELKRPKPKLGCSAIEVVIVVVVEEEEEEEDDDDDEKEGKNEGLRWGSSVQMTRNAWSIFYGRNFEYKVYCKNEFRLKIIIIIIIKLRYIVCEKRNAELTVVSCCLL
jgi:hypothetical protein